MFSNIHNDEEEERLPLLDLERLTQIPTPSSVKQAFFSGAVLGLIEMIPRALASKLLADSFFDNTTFSWIICADVIAIESYCVWDARPYKPQEQVADSEGCDRLGHVVGAFRQGTIAPRRFSSQRSLLRGRVEDTPPTWATRLGTITGCGIALILGSPYLLYVIGAKTLVNATSSSSQLIRCYLQSQSSCTPVTLPGQSIVSIVLFPITLIIATNNIGQARPVMRQGSNFIHAFQQGFRGTLHQPNQVIKYLLTLAWEKIKHLCSSAPAAEATRLIDAESPAPSRPSTAVIFIGILLGIIRIAVALFFLLAANLDVPIGLSPPSGTNNITGTQLTFSFGLLALGSFVTLLRFSSPTTTPTTTSWMSFLSDLLAHPFQAPAKIAASIGWCDNSTTIQDMYQPINGPASEFRL